MQVVTVQIRLSEPFADSPDMLRLAMDAVREVIDKRLIYRERRWFYFGWRLVSIGEVKGVWHDPVTPDLLRVTIEPDSVWMWNKRLTLQMAEQGIRARLRGRGMPGGYALLPAE